MVHSIATLRALGKENASPSQTVLKDDLDAKVTPGKEWRLVGGLATPEEGVRRVKRVAAQPLRPSLRALNVNTALATAAGDVDANANASPTRNVEAHMERFKKLSLADALDEHNAGIERMLAELEILKIDIDASQGDRVETQASAPKVQAAGTQLVGNVHLNDAKAPIEVVSKVETAAAGLALEESGPDGLTPGPNLRLDSVDVASRAPKRTSAEAQEGPRVHWKDSGSSIQARIAAVFAAANAPQARPAHPSIRVRRLRTPTLLESDRASQDVRVQREIEALRGLGRVEQSVRMLASGGVKAQVEDGLTLGSMYVLAQWESGREEDL